MIVCSCNVLTDGEIKTCFDGSENEPRTAAEVYAALGCTPRCGRCKPTIRDLVQKHGTGRCCCESVDLCNCAGERPLMEARA